MKRLSVFIAACVFAVACKPDPQPTPQPQPDPQPEAKVEFKIVSQNPMEFAAEGGDCVIRYEITNPDESLNVSASTDVDWITETDATYAGQNEIVLVVTKNDGEARTAKIVLTYDKQYEVVVNQEAAPVEPEPEPEPEATELPYLSAVYYGNQYGASENDYNYSLVLATSENVIDIITGEYIIYADNTYLLLDLFSDQPSANYTLSFNVPVGEYELDLDNTCVAGTIGAEYTYLYVTGETEGIETHFVSGKVTVTEEDINVELVAEDGTEYKFHTPAVSVDNHDLFNPEGLMGEFSSLEGDLEIAFGNPSLYAECYGDYFVVGKNSWIMYIDDYDTYQSVILELLTPYEDEIPAGEFKVTTDLTNERIILPGYATTSGEAMWSWYVAYGDDGYETIGQAPIVDGTMTITDNGDETFTAVCDLVDDLGNKITGECTAYFEAVGPYYRKAAADTPARVKHHVVKPTR
jgi:hypothetical protein